jgi:gliding motility-associated lipoprotein GldH
MNYSGPSGFISTDTLEFPLAYPDGRWIGTGAGDMVDTRFSFGRNFKFSEPGIHKVSFKHGMRYDDLSPVFDIGLRIEYADEKD